MADEKTAADAQEEMLRTLLRKGVQMGISVGLQQALRNIADVAYQDLEARTKLWSPAKKAMEKAYGSAGATVKRLLEDKAWRKASVEMNAESLLKGIMSRIIEEHSKANGESAKEE